MTTRLVVKDLYVSKELDKKAMDKITGGEGRPTGGQKPKEGETKFWSTIVWYYEVDKDIVIT